MKKTNPLLLWVILWVLGVFIITVKNRLAAGVEVELGNIIFLNLILDVAVIPISLFAYFLTKIISNAVGAKDFLAGKNALRNVAATCVVLFLIVFLFPLFKS